jgi:DNA polymerase epsilon subunit 1
MVFNEESEKATLEKFFKLIQVYKPSVITTFNGDKFDIPFIEIRCEKVGINFETESGLYLDSEG